MLVILLVVGALSTCYFGWALHRVGNKVLIADDQWPRPWPYPDTWLLRLNDWYEARHPVPPGAFKLHGELRRVQATVFASALTSAALGLVSAVALATHRVRPRK